MAQRKEARVFVTIWDDAAFRAHTSDAQRLYLFLLSQKDLSYCGVIALRERRWARAAAGLTVDQVVTAIEELAAPRGDGLGQPLIVVDEDTGELLVRSLVRHDGIWRVPNFLKAARESAEPVESPRIRAALADELRRLPLEETDSKQIKPLVDAFISDLEKGSAKGSRNPSGKGSANPSGKGSRNPRTGGGADDPDPPADSPPGGYKTPPTPDQGVTGDGREEPTGQGPDRKGSRKGSGNPSAKGSQGNRGTSTTCTTDSPVPPDPGSPAPRGPHPPGKASSEIAPRSSDPTPPAEPARDDEHAAAERLCQHLADRIAANDSKRPNITDKWRDAARLMLTRDGRTEEQIRACIDWCQADDFWHRNILSMPKLREKYDQLRLAAKPSARQHTSNRHTEASAAAQLAEVFE